MEPGGGRCGAVKQRVRMPWWSQEGRSTRRYKVEKKMNKLGQRREKLLARGEGEKGLYRQGQGWTYRQGTGARRDRTGRIKGKEGTYRQGQGREACMWRNSCQTRKPGNPLLPPAPESSPRTFGWSGCHICPPTVPPAETPSSSTDETSTTTSGTLTFPHTPRANQSSFKVAMWGNKSLENRTLHSLQKVKIKA